MKKKSRLEVLRGRLQRMGIKAPVRDDMPEDVAASFLAEMRICDDCAAAAATNWTPESPACQVVTDELLAAFGIG